MIPFVELHSKNQKFNILIYGVIKYNDYFYEENCSRKEHSVNTNDYVKVILFYIILFYIK